MKNVSVSGCEIENCPFVFDTNHPRIIGWLNIVLCLWVHFEQAKQEMEGVKRECGKRAQQSQRRAIEREKKPFIPLYTFDQ